MFASCASEIKEERNKLKIKAEEINHKTTSVMQTRLLCFSQFNEEIKFLDQNTRVQLRSKPGLHPTNRP